MDIRMPDQSKRTITVYVVDKYIKIVEAISKYGYIYEAESFTVDSNNIGKSGTDGPVGGGSSGNGSGSRTGYEYAAVYVGGDPDSEGKNPAAEGMYYIDSHGNFVKATETGPVYGRAYYSRSRPTYYKASATEGTNPKANGWYEYSNGRFTKTNDTSVVSGKTYYTSTKPGSGGGGGGGGGTTYTYEEVILTPNANPAALGLWYIDNGSYVAATETKIVLGRTYYKRKESSGGGGGGGGGGGSTTPTYHEVTASAGDNPAQNQWWEKRAFTIDSYIRTTDTSPKPGKKYYEPD